MRATIRRTATAAGILIFLLFILFVINQTVQVVDLASRVSPILAVVLFWCLIAMYGALLALPAVIFLRLPKPIRPPASDDSAEFSLYLEQLRKRLGSNPLLKGHTLSERRDIEGALAFLGGKADVLIKKAASRVFITTAISQNGRLDAFLVLSTLSQMVWQIARLFYQRPGPRDFVNLYANVAATTFLASELDDIDLHDQLAPILSSAVGSVALSVPGTALVVNSILTGSGNAFLVLRVGVITKSYCSALHAAERRSIRRSATIEATRLLGSVVGQGTAKISKAVWDASKEKMVGKMSGAATRMKEAGRKLISKAPARGNETAGAPESQSGR